jgi:hypothetical protein
LAGNDPVTERRSAGLLRAGPLAHDFETMTFRHVERRPHPLRERPR